MAGLRQKRVRQFVALSGPAHGDVVDGQVGQVRARPPVAIPRDREKPEELRAEVEADRYCETLPAWESPNSLIATWLAV